VMARVRRRGSLVNDVNKQGVFQIGQANRAQRR
jgi:hypothetical protein